MSTAIQSTGYRVCTRCIMDTSDPTITFDEQGQCSHCHSYFARAKNELYHDADGQKRFKKLIAEIKTAGQGKDYDCLIGLSGGVDSSMVAYRCKQEGLRPLAVHFDNGWNSELAVGNIEKIVNVLKIDLYTHVMDWDEFRDLQLSFLKASVANCEIPTDHGIVALLYKMAAEKKISYIISGANLETEGIMSSQAGYDNRDFKHIKAIHKRFGTVPLKTFPHLSILNFFKYMVLNQLKYVRILNAAPYNRDEAIRTLEKELGWRNYGGKHHESIYTRFYQGYILPKKFGFDKRRSHLSSMICSGQITREEALHEVQKSHYDPELIKSDLEYVSKKFGLTVPEFEKILAQPPVKHTDYPHAYAFQLIKKYGGLARKMLVKF